jgi:hypothetical protein
LLGFISPVGDLSELLILIAALTPSHKKADNPRLIRFFYRSEN